MKFGKTYHSYIKSANHNFCIQYKHLKKTLKKAKNALFNDIESLNFTPIQDIEQYDISPCCICLEPFISRSEGIQIKCCNNIIHPCCFIQSVEMNLSCPLCRESLQNILKNDKNTLNYYILYILSSLAIEIDLVENYYSFLFFKKKYAIMNTICIYKLLKKIDKNLYTNITGPFIKYNLKNITFFEDGMKHIKKSKKYNYLYERILQEKK